MTFHRRFARASVRGAVGLATSALVAAVPTWAQDANAPAIQRVVPSTRYDASGIHGFFFGKDHRQVWTTAIDAEVLDLRAFAGGLEPVGTGGGQQTQSLRFRAADGRPFTFRSLDKNPSAVLPPDLQGTFAARLVQDQVSSAYPSAPLVVDRILEAAGVLHSTPRIVVLPDDPALGEYRRDFAGRVGTLEQWPNVSDEAPAFAGASEIVSTDDLFTRLEDEPGNQVDVSAYLAARLIDILIGDWDRHRGQWRWARFGADRPHVWVPIPEDRDQAFARFDGLFLAIARVRAPQLVKFGEKIPGMLGMTWNGRDVDRRLLTGLEQPEWDSVAAALESRITDRVIDSAVRRLPDAHYQLDGARLAATLKSRRDGLRQAARAFYRHLAGEVDVTGTNLADSIHALRLQDTLDLAIYRRNGADGPYFRRRFTRGVTKEVRLYLMEGDDRVVLEGDGNAGVLVRVVSGVGDDQVLDASLTGGTRAYDSRGDAGLPAGQGVRVDRRSYTPPQVPPGIVPPRDWGTRWFPLATLTFARDVGAFVGGGFVFQRHGFRTYPYKRQHTFRAGYATEAKTFRAEYIADFRRMNSGVRATFRALASGIEIVRFHGFGNETSILDLDEFYRVKQEHYVLEPRLHIPVARDLTFSFGPTLKYASSDLDVTRFIGLTQPYGSDDFGQVGGYVGVTLDLRDQERAPRKGIFLQAAGTYYPSAWDVDSGAFGEVHGELATYVTASMPLEPTLALRVGGKKVWGTFPFQEAAFIGGRSTVRGFQEQRFAGDASLYGNAELRLYLSNFYLLLPGEFGIFGLGDVGRVYLDGETSDEWHSAFGGGLWFAYLNRRNTLSVSVANSDERTGVYVRAGFMF
jgi:hypothetical protein